MRLSFTRTSGRRVSGPSPCRWRVWRRGLSVLLCVALSVAAPGGVAPRLSGVEQEGLASARTALKLTFEEGDLQYFDAFDDSGPAPRARWAVEGGVLHAQAAAGVESASPSYLLLETPFIDFQLDAQMTFLGPGEAGFAFAFVDTANLARVLLDYARRRVRLEVLQGGAVAFSRELPFIAPRVPEPVGCGVRYDGGHVEVSLAGKVLFVEPLTLQPGRAGFVVRGQEDLLVHDLYAAPLSGSIAGNQPPRFGQISDRVGMVGGELSFRVLAYDPEHAPVTLRALDVPPGAAFSGNLFSWMPGEGQLGEFRATFEASDGTAVGRATVFFFILPPGAFLGLYGDPSGEFPGARLEAGPFIPGLPDLPFPPPDLPLVNPLGTAVTGTQLQRPSTAFEIPGTNITVDSSRGVTLIGGGQPVLPDTTANSTASTTSTTTTASATPTPTPTPTPEPGPGPGPGPTVVPGTQFSDDTAAAGAENYFAQGAAVGDVDGDGLEDLYLGNPFGLSVAGRTNNALLRNVGGAVFVDETEARKADGPAATQGAVFGDVDNDGDADLYLPVVGANVFFENDGGVFRNRSMAAGVDHGGAATGAVFADFDRDGLLDLYVVNAAGANVLYRNLDGGSFEDVTQQAGLNIFQTTKAAVVFDYDHDGDADIFNANLNKGHQLLRNNGDLTFTDVAPSLGLGRVGVATNVGVGDLDRDGDLDLVGTHLARGGVLLFENRVPAGGGFVERTDGSGAATVDFPMAAVVGDYDNDGDPDLYFPTVGGDNVMLENLGAFTFQGFSGSPAREPQTAFDAASADFNGDGKLDLYVVGIPGRYYRNTTDNGNHFLQIRLRGVQSNRFGVGARVDVRTNPLTTSQLSTGSGRSGASRLLHFGLGGATAASRITVNWPSGISQTLFDVSGDQVIEIKEIEPPSLSIEGETSVDEGEKLTFTVRATDPDGGIVQLSASDLPANATFVDNGNNTGTFTFMPDFTQAGTHSVIFSGFDGTFTRVLMIDVTVRNVNRAPVLDAIGPQSVVEGSTLTLDITASDPDGDSLSFDIRHKPAGAQFTDNGDGTATFRWTPRDRDVQEEPYIVTFRVSDGHHENDEEDVAITVLSIGTVNTPPVIAPLPDVIEAREGDALVFEVTAIDADGISGTIVLAAPVKPQGSSFSQVAIPSMTFARGVFEWTPDFDQSGDHLVRFTAFDGFATVEREVLIRVAHVNRAPSIEDLVPETVRVGERLRKTITASDPDGDPLSLTAPALPANATFTDHGDGTGTLTFTPDASQVGLVRIDFTASDGALSDTETLDVTVEAQGPSGPIFEDVTVDAGLEGQGVSSSGAAARDFDSDGDVDLLVLNDAPAGGEPVPLTLYLNDGSGGFPMVVDIPNPGGRTSFGGVVSGDFDRDGDPDLLVRGSAIYLQNQGGGAFIDQTAAAGLASADGDPVLADVDSDGLLDLFFVAPQGNRLWRNLGVSAGGTAQFADVTGALGGDSVRGVEGHQVGACFFDYNRDGRLDLYLVHSSGGPLVSPPVTDQLLRNEGSLAFTDVTASAGVADAGDGLGGPVLIDFDSDGQDDVLVLNRVVDQGGMLVGSNSLYRNKGDGTFEDKTQDAGLRGIAGQSGAFAVLDFDDDGDEDLYLAGDPALAGAGADLSKGGILLRNDGGVFTDVTPGAGATEAFKQLVGSDTVTRRPRQALVGDVNADGRPDIFAATDVATSGESAVTPNRLLANILQNDNHFLEVRLVGHESNLEGIHARVEVHTPARTLVRTLRGNGGNALAAHFGLGSGTTVDEVRVFWPSGNSQVAVAPSVDQVLVLEEPFANITALVARNITDGREAAGISFGDNPPGTGLKVAEQYLEIGFTLVDGASGLDIYTDNRALIPPFTGSGEGAGLVGRTDTTVALPIFYQVFDAVNGQASFPTDSLTNPSIGKMHDRARPDFFTDASLEERTLVTGSGLLAPYPLAGRQTAQSTIILYFATDFTNASQQPYATNLKVEAFVRS